MSAHQNIYVKNEKRPLGCERGPGAERVVGGGREGIGIMMMGDGDGGLKSWLVEREREAGGGGYVCTLHVDFGYEILCIC